MDSELETVCAAQKLMSSNSNPVHLCSEEANRQDLNLQIEEKTQNGTEIDDINPLLPDLVEPVEVLEDEKVMKLKEEIERNGWIDAGNDHNVVVDKEVKEAEGCKSLESAKLIEDKIEISDNIVLRKLLRGPRYFDLLDSSWGVCYNCGEEGHTAARCTLAKRKRPCFFCGSLDHNVKQCARGNDCFICKKGGHIAKDCPEKKFGGLSPSAKICLKCGQSGHEMYSCKNDYSSDDLKEIQCYICKNFGHLCCAMYTFTAGGNVSCYRCGQSGHTGLACRRSHGETNDVESASSCYRCGKGGHFARECTTSAKARKTLCGGPNEMESPSSCYKCGEGGHFARECTNLAKPYTRMPGEPNEMESPSTCYKCGQEGHFARECTSSAKATTRLRGGPNQMESPSSCYKCGERGHFARECSKSPMAYTRLREELFYMESSSSCYRCGGGGHFARECTSSVEAYTSLHGDLNGIVSTSSCYKCGEGGHFARECTTSAKSFKRNRELSTPKYKCSKQKKDSFNGKSWPRDFGKAHKRKRTQYEGEFSTPVKSKSRGGWITDDPGDLPQQKARKKGWKSPATPTSKHRKLQKSSGGGYSSKSRSPRNFLEFQSKNSTPKNSKLYHGLSTRKFRRSSNRG